MNKFSGQDRRRHRRVEGNIPLKISTGEFDLVTETKNLSRTGAFCRVNQYVEPMTKLKIHLLLNFRRNKKILTKKISCDGVVVRTESDPEDDSTYNIAIFFNEISERAADTLAEFVESSDGKPV